MKKKLRTAALAACLLLLGVWMGPGEAKEAKKDADPVANSYIVALRDGADVDGHAKGKKAKKKFETVGAYSVEATPEEAAALAEDPDVDFVQPDGYVYAAQDEPTATRKRHHPGFVITQQLPTGINRAEADKSTQASGNYSGANPAPGIAVMDSGIYAPNSDITVAGGYDCTSPATTDYRDRYGHGTHVAGTAAAQDDFDGVVGADPGANVYAIKVLGDNGVGTWEAVLCGVDQVNQLADAGQVKVANMSFSAPYFATITNDCGAADSDALHRALCDSANLRGVTYVAAAGNDAADAATYRPAGYDDAVITVSALADYNGLPYGGAAPTCDNDGADDTFAAFSNHGAPVDIGAPGTCILSTYLGNQTAVQSGASQAAPHVAGAAALYLDAHAGARWTEVRDALKAHGEPLGAGHADPSGRHLEPVLRMDGL